jgi:hypothetical protein
MTSESLELNRSCKQLTILEDPDRGDRHTKMKKEVVLCPPPKKKIYILGGVTSYILTEISLHNHSPSIPLNLIPHVLQHLLPDAALKNLNHKAPARQPHTHLILILLRYPHFDTKAVHAVSERTHNRAVFIEMVAADRPETRPYFRQDTLARDEATGGLVGARSGKHCGGTDEGGEWIWRKAHRGAYLFYAFRSG